MNMSWITMIGGGVTAAVTLGVGISMSGILASDSVSQDSNPVEIETIYVEQPVIEVEASPLEIAGTSPDPILIAILPAQDSHSSSTNGSVMTERPSIPAPTSGHGESSEADDEYLSGDEENFDEGEGSHYEESGDYDDSEFEEESGDYDDSEFEDVEDHSAGEYHDDHGSEEHSGESEED